ncbi:c-type cytochrome [Labrys wisconsinensis]|uniref:Cytochrome c n=1 Tax=Labrys wisconsinensis TaxID=425677 RepID=A0ABU0JFL4_9HYPH|nr:c-type cytochrome [Labrys wisconsinensis]MDQ0473080.1 cytochrome c [Labrys wisconsinensis]
MRRLLAVAAALLAGGAVGVLAPRLLADRPAPSAPAEVPAMPPAASFDPVFEPCAHCHQIGVGARSSTGPALEGVIGRRAGKAAGYPFSAAMRGSGLVWDEASLSRFIEDPQGLVPGTRMIFTGIDDPERRAAIVAYIAKAGGRP